MMIELSEVEEVLKALRLERKELKGTLEEAKKKLKKKQQEICKRKSYRLLENIYNTLERLSWKIEDFLAELEEDGTQKEWDEKWEIEGKAERSLEELRLVRTFRDYLKEEGYLPNWMMERYLEIKKRLAEDGGDGN